MPMGDAGCDNQDVIPDGSILMILVADVGKLRIFINSRNFAKEYSRISLILQKFTDRRCNLGWRKHRCRHRIEQRLKEIVVRSVNHPDLRFCVSKRLSGGEPSKAGADDHDSFHSWPQFVINS